MEITYLQCFLKDRHRGDISLRLMAFCSLCGKVRGDLRSQWVSDHSGSQFQQKCKPKTETSGHILYNFSAKQAHKWFATTFFFF